MERTKCATFFLSVITIYCLCKRVCSVFCLHQFAFICQSRVMAAVASWPCTLGAKKLARRVVHQHTSWSRHFNEPSAPPSNTCETRGGSGGGTGTFGRRYVSEQWRHLNVPHVAPEGGSRRLVRSSGDCRASQQCLLFRLSQSAGVNWTFGVFLRRFRFTPAALASQCSSLSA